MHIPPNHTLQRTRLSRSGCNPRVLRAGSLRLGHWAAFTGGLGCDLGLNAMSPARKSVPVDADAEKRLKAFIGKFEPKDQRVIHSVRAAVRARLPTANELVWDNFNFFVIGYSPTKRPTDSIASIAARANSVGLCFIQGASLRDPKKLLLGSGRQTRFIRVESASVLTHPDGEALIAGAIDRAKTPLASARRGRLIIRSVAVKQRSRRKLAMTA